MRRDVLVYEKTIIKDGTMRKFFTIIGIIMLATSVFAVGGTRNWGYSTADLYGQNCIQDYIDGLVAGTITNNLNVTGDAAISGTATVAGNIVANGNIKGDGATDIDTMETITCDNLVVSTAVTIVEGALTDRTIVSADMADADHGDVSWSSGVATVDNCAAANLSGNIAIARMTNGLVDAIGADQMVDEDHGDVSWSSGVATVDNCAAANLSGNIAIARMTNGLIDAIGADQMSDTDHGAVSWSSGVATVDAVTSVALPAAITNSTTLSHASLAVDGLTGTFSTSVEAPKVYLTSANFLQEVGTTLVYVANSGAATNVLDADITTP